MTLPIVIYILCVLFTPWWSVVAAGLFLLVRYNLIVAVIAGALILDLIFGEPIASVHGISVLYTPIFIALALASEYLRATILE